MEKNQNVQATKGKISGPLLFSLKLLSVERVHKSVSLKIQPFSELNDTTKRRKMLCLSQSILDAVEEEKENVFHPTDQIKLKQVKFESFNNLYDINFGQLDIIGEIKRIEAVVKSLDRNHVSREAYRSLARIEHSIPREEAVSNT